MNILQQFALFVGVFGISGVLFFEQSLASRLLESGVLENTIPRVQFEEFAADVFGADAQYSWYGSEGFHPAVFVMLEKDGVRRKVSLNAFSGEILDAHFDAEKDESLSGFLMRVASEEAVERERILQEQIANEKALTEKEELQRLQAEAEKIAQEEEQKKKDLAEEKRVADFATAQEQQQKDADRAAASAQQKTAAQEAARLAAEQDVAAEAQRIADKRAAEFAAEKAAALEAQRIADQKAADVAAQKKQKQIKTRAS